MSQRFARLVVGVVLPLIILALGLLPIVVQWSRPPATMATHFTLGATHSDGSMSRTTYFLSLHFENYGDHDGDRFVGRTSRN